MVGGGGLAQHLPLTVQFLGRGDRNRLSARDEDEGGLFLRGKGVSSSSPGKIFLAASARNNFFDRLHSDAKVAQMKH